MLSMIVCLATAIYHEARGEPVAGQYAVAEVIVNRRNDERFPDTVCGVVEQRSSRGCQFSYMCTDDLQITETLAYVRARRIAVDVLTTDPSEFIHAGDALYFHGTHIAPSWSRRMDVTARIGGHVFLAEH